MAISGCSDIGDPASVGNQPPTMPSNPTPADNAEDVSIDSELSWSCTDPDGDPLLYDIYFGTTGDLLLIGEGVSSTTFNPGVLEFNAIYQWKVIAKDDHQNRTEGVLWSFTTADEGGGSGVSWSGDILPILQQNSCVFCHGGSGRLNLDNYAALMRGGESGPVVIPGDGDNSLLYKRVDGFSAGDRMPRGGARLDQSLIDKIRDWINEGALDN